MEPSATQSDLKNRILVELAEVFLSPSSAHNVVLQADFRKVGRLNADAAFWIPYSGGLEARIDTCKQTIHCVPGDILFFPAPVYGRLSTMNGREAQVTTVHFFPSIMGSWQTFAQLGFPFHCRGDLNSPWYVTGRYMGELFKARETSWQREVASIIVTILFHMVRKYSEQFQPSKLRAGNPAWARIRPALRAMDTGFRDPSFSAADMAKAAGLGPSRFRQVFRKATGVSPAHQLRQRRVDEARRFLLVSDLRCAQIARNCGFTDTAYFFRTFKQLVKKTPLEYRESPT